MKHKKFSITFFFSLFLLLAVFMLVLSSCRGHGWDHRGYGRRDGYRYDRYGDNWSRRDYDRRDGYSYDRYEDE